MATVSLNGIKKTFGKTDVIHGIDVEIEDGEFIVIVGPSGCGKSTLLRMVAGLETVTEGEIRIGGARVNDREPMDRDIAMVFQNYALYPHMSVFDNMAYGLKIAGTSKAEIAERVNEAATLLQLSDYLHRRPRELSGGQRQRVAMGRAIVRKPSVFLFDEPLSNLDAKLRVQMRLEIKQLQRRLGVTSLYANPQTEFVAGFIGSPPMNFLPSDIEADAPDGARTLGVRPEHLRIASSGTPATVVYSEALGAETLVHVSLPQGGQATVRQDATMPLPAEGTAVHLDWNATDRFFFDADGRRN